MSIQYRFLYHWRRFWARRNGPRGFGRVAARFAACGLAPYQSTASLAALNPRGFVAHDAYLIYPDLTLGQHVFIGGRVTLTVGDKQPGPVRIGDRAQLYGDTFLQTGRGGSIRIGAGTHIQPGCHFRAFVRDIEIGAGVEIASGCACYSFDHGIEAGTRVMDQPLTSKGPIVIGDGAWLGHGVTVLSGVSIGVGAVVAAGAVVTRDVPADAIAAGVPARVIRQRPGAGPGREDGQGG